MMAAKYIHRNLRLVIPIPTTNDQHMHFARLSTERSTLKQEQSYRPPSPPASPNGKCSHLPTASSLLSPPSPSSNHHQSVTQQALRALRMEIEFLHFLQYDLTCSDPTSLVRWAHQDEEEEHHSCHSPPLSPCSK